MTKPLVSALIDTYNQAQFIEQALVSVLEQGLSPSELEIVVVDDGSTDNTAAAVERFGRDIRYIRKTNGGQVSAYNAGVPETHAPIVAFLDADDWWAKGKLQAVLDAFERNPDVTAVGHGYFEAHEAESTIEAVLPVGNQVFNLTDAGAARMAHSAWSFLGTTMLSVRRNVIDIAGHLPENLIFFDRPVQLFAMTLGSAFVLDQALCYYRLHGQNLFQSRMPDTKNLRRRYQFLSAQLNFLPGALARAGVTPDAQSALFESDRAECKRLRLILEGGWPWETFRLERERFQLAYQQHTAAYGAFKWLVLASTLFMPPSIFYRMRNWYARHNLRRFRRVVGDPIPVASIHVRRQKSVNGSAISDRSV
ncbi:MAG TPA: glycosyltransferase [Terriglobia bacterium]|nr:glycosyltransferase [Terriglobia bacterium]